MWHGGGQPLQSSNLVKIFEHNKTMQTIKQSEYFHVGIYIIADLQDKR